MNSFTPGSYVPTMWMLDVLTTCGPTIADDGKYGETDHLHVCPKCYHVLPPGFKIRTDAQVKRLFWNDGCVSYILCERRRSLCDCQCETYAGARQEWISGQAYSQLPSPTNGWKVELR